jgi:SAM-dependent methyltransferase
MTISANRRPSTPLLSSSGEFWSARYRKEGAIWGDAPSPSAMLLADRLSPGSRVLEVGCGYGRDLCLLLQQGHAGWGIDLSSFAVAQTRRRLKRAGISARALYVGRFEELALHQVEVDALLSHRTLHLLVEEDAVEHFSQQLRRVLVPGGLVCLGIRASDDLRPEKMLPVSPGVYEYRDRPGHQIRYWDRDAFHAAFAGAFAIESFHELVEPESADNPVPCRLIVMIARLR